MRGVFRHLILFTVIGPVSASAQGTAQQRSDCMGDALRFCSSDVPFVSKIEECLQANIGQLSPACRGEFAPAKKNEAATEEFSLGR